MSVAPKKELGQHFLVDENILGVIGRLSDLKSDDVVLEVGPGLGVLTRYLAERVRLVHAVEIDRALAEPLSTTLGERENVRLIFGDALRLDLGALEPAPRKLVANLPYNIATPLVVETDSPYLAPQPVRGLRNEPAHVVHTIAALADARGEELQAFAAQTHENAAAAFGLP